MRREARSKKQEVRRWGWLAACAVLTVMPAWGQLLPTGPKLVQNVAGGAASTPPPPRWPLRDRSKGIALALSAQAEAKPALQYALLPRVEETEKGNAAVKYITGSSEWPELKQEESDLLDTARQNAPLAELNEKEEALSAIVNRARYSLRMLKEGARLEGVDWESNMRREGFKGLLPSLGKFRTAAYVLALEIRFDIKRHDWTAAREKLDTGFALARHMGQGETLIESLVGVAIGSSMCLTLEDWVAEPGSPNLYWPLANLPAPFNDLRRPMDFERANVYFSFPEMKEIKQGHYSPDQWSSLIGHWLEFGEMSSAEPIMFGNGSVSLPMRQASTTALGMLMYPQAKDFLQQRGMSRAAVEKMPVSEALERYFVTSWDEEADDIFKWAGLPLKDATEGMQQAERDLLRRHDSGDANWFASMFLPMVGRARLLAARLDRQIAALQVIEALRAYAAEKGALPESLAALKLPVPKDPTTDSAFGYEVKAGTAVLSSPSSEPRGILRYELTLRK